MCVWSATGGKVLSFSVIALEFQDFFGYVHTVLHSGYPCTSEICRLVRAFNPNFATIHVDDAFVDSMAAITPLNGLNMLVGMKRELPQYLAAANGAMVFDKTDVEDFTKDLLNWWRVNGKSPLPSHPTRPRVSVCLHF